MRRQIKSTQFNCKRCGQLVWIKNQTKEAIIDEDTGETYIECGLCRSCFVNRKVKSEDSLDSDCKQPEGTKKIESEVFNIGNSFYERVARGEEECPEKCVWKGHCLKGTKFDDGKGGLVPGEFAPWINLKGVSPCYIVSHIKINQ